LDSRAIPVDLSVWHRGTRLCNRVTAQKRLVPLPDNRNAFGSLASELVVRDRRFEWRYVVGGSGMAEASASDTTNSLGVATPRENGLGLKFFPADIQNSN
jgi:hypothetical protein